MEAKRSKVNKVLLLAVGIILLVAVLGAILLSHNVTKAEELDSNWNYPSSWTKIGGDQSLVKVNATTVLKSQNYESSSYRQGGDTHDTLTIDDINKKGYPAINIMRTFLKGYFEGNYYIAVLIDLHMSPGNNSSTPDWIRSANAMIETHIYKGKKVGNWLVSYWPTTEQAGSLVSCGPRADITAETENYVMQVGSSTTGNITASFSAGESNEVKRLQIRANPLPLNTSDKLYGFEARYLYYKPFDDGDSYLNSSSLLRYCTIYLCDPSVEYYNINVIVKGEFFYDGTGLSNAIVRASDIHNYYIKPSNGFFMG